MHDSQELTKDLLKGVFLLEDNILSYFSPHTNCRLHLDAPSASPPLNNLRSTYLIAFDKHAMPRASLTAKDTTAEKVPSGYGGFGAFLGGGGYATIICCPVSMIIMGFEAIRGKREKKQQREQADEENDPERGAQEAAAAREKKRAAARKEDEADRMHVEKQAARTGGPMPLGTSRRDEASGVGGDAPGRSTSPGLLAV